MTQQYKKLSTDTLTQKQMENADYARMMDMMFVTQKDIDFVIFERDDTPHKKEEYTEGKAILDSYRVVTLENTDDANHPHLHNGRMFSDGGKYGYWVYFIKKEVQ